MIRDGDPLRGAARRHPAIQAVRTLDGDVAYDYRDLDARVDRIAAGLDADGIGHGDRVALRGGLDADVPVALHACWRVGATVVPIDPELGADRLAARLDRVDVTRTIRTVSGNRGARLDAIDASPSTAVGDRPPADPACILFTSGTTGGPTPVELSWRNLTINALASALRLGHRRSDRWATCLSPFHMGGLAPYVRAAVYGTGVVIHDPTLSAIDAAAERAGATGISLVPTLLSRGLDEGISLATYRTVLVGGDRTPPELVERALEADVPLYCSYGMTEAASQIATATPGELRDDPTTVGAPLRGVTISIADPGSDGIGEIVVTGGTVATGERLETGDLGYLEDGRLQVTGRRADRIVTGGETVDAATVTDILESHPSVEAAAVVGIPDPEWGERVGALLVTTDPPAPILADLAADFGSGERPRTVETGERIPRTPSGTIDRPAVRRLIDEETS